MSTKQLSTPERGGIFWRRDQGEKEALKESDSSHPEIDIHNRSDETCNLSACSPYDYKRSSGAYRTIQFRCRHLHSWVTTHAEMSLTSSLQWWLRFQLYTETQWEVYAIYMSLGYNLINILITTLFAVRKYISQSYVYEYEFVLN